ncbi:hypothetical protein NIES4071_74470 [Calothrix sp. NIES-4071]|nr:hypothetical protein NIES4071_74470 [Calothrix sp. NIES-4071]BAZ61722.1 hypothetical protein NIES4105_74420 [Calothrix sp. NIES-4105]
MTTTSTKDFNRNSVSAPRVFPVKEPEGRYWTGNKIKKSFDTNISSRKINTSEFLEDKQDIDISSRKINTSEFLEDKQDIDISSRKIDTPEFLEDKQDINISSRKIDTCEFLEDKQDLNISSRKIDTCEFLEDKQDLNISSRKTRRLKGTGSGCIYHRKVIKKGKEYYEAYYQYEFWDKGDCLIKSSKYIQKKLLAIVQELNQQKVPVREILEILGEIV